jgi:pilus assembly protein Flp/PilA
MQRIRAATKRLLGRNEEGATMVEYALMLALIAAVCVATVVSIGTTANNAFTTVLTNF